MVSVFQSKSIQAISIPAALSDSQSGKMESAGTVPGDLDTEVRVILSADDADYICLTDMARFRDNEVNGTCP